MGAVSVTFIVHGAFCAMLRRLDFFFSWIMLLNAPNLVQELEFVIFSEVGQFFDDNLVL